MASFGKVLDLLDDRYLKLQDVTGNVEPLPTLVPYEEYAQNVLVYRMDTNHEIFLGLVQDFTMRRAHETHQELWTWFVQWEVDSGTPKQQPPSPKKVRLDVQQTDFFSQTPLKPRQTPALTIFERRTLDGALMLEEDMLRILIDIVQVASSLVPNFIEFLYRWVDYYEGDGKALKAALRWEIPSLWDFEYHPLVLPREEGKEGDTKDEDDTEGQRETGQGSASDSKAAELRRSSPTKKMHARPKPDLAAIELRTFYAEESERLQYREVKFGIQPPRLEQPLPPLINIPRDQRKRTKYYAACFKSRQRALCLLLEADITMRQINNYQKLQTAHPKETLEMGDGNGLRNYQKDAKYAQAHFELKEKQTKQREIAISNKLAVEAQLAASHAIPDGAAGLPLIPPTPSYARKTNMAAAMMRRIKETKDEKDEIINIVPKPLAGRMKSKLFERAKQDLELMPLRDFMAETGWLSSRRLTLDRRPSTNDFDDDKDDEDINTNSNPGSVADSETGNEDATTVSVSALSLPRPSLPTPTPSQPPIGVINSAHSLNDTTRLIGQQARNSRPVYTPDQPTPPNIATYMQNLNTEQVQRLVPLLSPEARPAAAHRFQDRASSHANNSQPSSLFDDEPARSSGFGQPEHTINPHVLPRLSETSRARWLPVPPPIFSQGLGAAMDNRASHTAVPGPSMPSQQIQDSLLARPHHPLLSSSVTQGWQDLSSSGPQRTIVTEESRNTPAYELPPKPIEPPSSVMQLASPVPTGFNAEHFTYSRHQKGASSSATTRSIPEQSTQPFSSSTQSGPQPPPISTSDLRQQTPAQRQRVLSADFAAQLDAHPPEQSPLVQPLDLIQSQRRSEGALHVQAHFPLSPPSPLLTPSNMQPQARLPSLQPIPSIHTTYQPPPNPSSIPSPNMLPSRAMLPPPRPGIIRNAPLPLSLCPPNPSPFTNLGPEILATSPFLDLTSNTNAPIQIYLPRAIVPANGIGPGGTKMGNSGYAETDALMLGHEDAKNGALVLSKAIFLPVGVWENTLRKARSGRWRVVETYPYLFLHAGNAKGKARMDSETARGCHRAVYDKLAQAYGMINVAPVAREDELTKRWRVTRGPMTSCDRGAVWEGWGVYVNRGIEMSAAEREDALRSEREASARLDYGGVADGYGSYSDACEAERRRKEMEELMDEDEMDD